LIYQELSTRSQLVLARDHIQCTRSVLTSLTSVAGWLESNEENWSRVVEIVKAELRKTEGYKELDESRGQLKFVANIAIAVKQTLLVNARYKLQYCVQEISCKLPIH